MDDKKRIVTAKIDWISVTGENNIYPSDFPTKRKEMKRGMMGYDTGLQYLDGRIELCSSTRKDMGVHIIISGDTIERLEKKTGRDSFSILQDFSESKCTRLDIAVDIMHRKLSISNLWKMVCDEKVKTRSTAFLHIEGKKGMGETVYIGSPKSNKRLRIYDKKAEVGAEFEWTRVELQLRREDARGGCIQINSCNSDEKKKVETISSMINSFASFDDDEEWKSSMGEISKEILRDKELRETNRKKWLLSSVVSAMASEIVASGKEDVMEMFMKRVERKVSTLRSEYKG